VKGKIAINKDLCKGCKYCIISCPKGLIEIEEKFNGLGVFPAYARLSGKCTGCALCAEMCPEIAIEVWKEKD
jgi:2-oxoglutarate ferredoxin oxidoreductase subunit delta